MVRGLPAYAATAFGARTATETVGPALILVVAASGVSPARGPWLVATVTGVAAVVGPLVGVLLDRSRHPARLFGATMLLLAASLLALALLVTRQPELPLGLLLAVAAVAGVAEPALTGAWTAQLTSFVPSDRLPRAFAVDVATYNLGGIVGPVVAGAALLLGSRGPLVVPAVMLVAALTVLPAVPLTARPLAAARTSPLRDLRIGVGALVGRPALRRTTLLTTFGLAGQAALVIGAPGLAIRLTGGLTFVGLLLGAFALGGLLAVAALVRFPLRLSPDAVVVGAVAAGALAQVLTAFAPHAWMALAGAFAMGVADGPMVTAMMTVRGREAPAAAVAQVFTMGASLRTGGYALATALFGTLVGHGFRTILLAGVGVEVVGLALGALSGRGGRR